MPNQTTTFFGQNGQPVAIGAMSSEALRPASEARSLPPNDANSLTYPRAQRHPHNQMDPSTPASTAGGPRQSIDATSTTGNSPSQFFGGVEQLMREGQDWWLRDQSQLAVGFDNWNISENEMAAWLNSTNGVGSPGTTTGYTSSPVMTGVDMNGMNGVNGNSNGNGINGHAANINAINGYGGALNYNEQDWYQ